MKTHFARLRRFTVWSSVSSPFLFFVAFLFVVFGWTAWAAVPVILGIFLLCAFPIESRAVDQSEEMSKKVVGLLTIVGAFLALFWIESIPEWDPFIDRLISKEVAQDWRPITTVFIWICIWSYTNYQKACSLEDREIVALFDDNQSSQNKEAEQGGDGDSEPAV